ncbi:MAG: 16S rRNA (cytosine(1402)-N(4))-methyltransferase RsmH [Solirubrobacteraceae bacterium]
MATLLDMTIVHVPVLAAELLEALEPRPGQVVVDCTVGGGGHARLVGERLGPTGTLIGIDRDPTAAERFDEIAHELPCETRFIRGSFVDGLATLHEDYLSVDAAYFDLGTSAMQIDAWERGFSYTYDAPLDMRMDQSQERSAREVVGEWDQADLARIFRDYGEERYARQIARAIVTERTRAPISTTLELVEVIKAAVPAPARFASGHPARRVFQAIRIAVNDELDQLDRALPLAWDLLAPGGRLAAISFHSLEDRRVKQFFAARSSGCTCPPGLPVCVCGASTEATLPRRRAVFAGASELTRNPRAASARLRVARKVEVES